MFARARTRARMHAPVHYWPAAEASHFPVFIKTRPIKFYLQSIIRTLQINQRQLNQCIPGPGPGPPWPSWTLHLLRWPCARRAAVELDNSPPPGLLVIIRQRRPSTQVLLTVALHREAPGLIPLARQCGGAGGNGGSSGSRGPGRGLRGTSGNKNAAFSQLRVFVPVSRTSLSRHDM